MFQPETFYEATGNSVYLGSQGSVPHKNSPSPASISPPSKGYEEDDMDSSDIMQNYTNSEIPFPFPPSQPRGPAVDSDSMSMPNNKLYTPITADTDEQETSMSPKRFFEQTTPSPHLAPNHMLISPVLGSPARIKNIDGTFNKLPTLSQPRTVSCTIMSIRLLSHGVFSQENVHSQTYGARISMSLIQTIKPQTIRLA